MSTIHQPAGELGRAAAKAVLAQLRGERIETPIMLDCPVVWRESA
ncbi:hypothetical protein [Microbacterium aurantiacum]